MEKPAAFSLKSVDQVSYSVKDIDKTIECVVFNIRYGTVDVQGERRAGR